MQYLIRLPIMLMIIAALSACATAPGREFSEIAPTSADKGNVYLYRTNALFAMAEAFPVSVDGQIIEKLFNKSYLVLPLTPGTHVLKVAPGGLAKASEISVQVDAGTTSFYEYDFVTGPLANYFFIGSSIQPRDKEIAVTALKQLKAAQADIPK